MRLGDREVDEAPLPVILQMIIPEDYLDLMGHMNVMWYTHLFSRATGKLFDLIGLDRDYLESNHAGVFALEHHVRFLKEVRCGQAITIRTRPLGRSAKRLHFMHFMIKHETGIVAATEEFVDAHMDMKARRMAAIPRPIAGAYDRLLTRMASLNWDPPVCGVMKP